MPKATVAVWLKIDADRVVPGLQEAAQKLDKTKGEMVIDFSSVRRIDPSALREMEKLIGAADDRAIKVGVRGVNVNVYKVLKLVKLAPRFSFLT
jgi:anti-anti-sigma regulatory factor